MILYLIILGFYNTLRQCRKDWSDQKELKKTTLSTSWLTVIMVLNGRSKSAKKEFSFFEASTGMKLYIRYMGILLGLSWGGRLKHLHAELVLSLSILLGCSTAGGHDGHDAGPPDSHHLGAYEQDEAGGEEAATRDSEEDEESGLGVAKVVPPDHKCRVVRGVVAREPGWRGLVPGVLTMSGVELRTLQLERVDTALVVDVQPCPRKLFLMNVKR